MLLPLFSTPPAVAAPQASNHPRRASIRYTSASALLTSFAIALLGVCGDAFGQPRECSTHGCVNQIRETSLFGATTSSPRGALEGHSRGRLQSVDGFGATQDQNPQEPSEQAWLSGPSGTDERTSDDVARGEVGTGVTSRGSADLRGPITRDPCSKAITFVSNIDIDTDGRGNTVASRTELPETSFQSRGRSLNSDRVNFIVMPGNCGEYLGHYASVTYRGETVYGIVGDCGPAGKTGEVSTAMAKELSDKLHRKGKGQGVPRFIGDGDHDHFKGFAEDGATYTIYPQGVSRSASLHGEQIDAGARDAASIAAGCAQRRRKSSLDDSMKF